MTTVPKSIKFHYNLSEQEVRAYYSIKNLEEDTCLYEKRLVRILNDYIDTKDFKNNNAKLCFKKQLKKMIKDDKTETPKFEAFNMWRLFKIDQHISKCKSYLLEVEGKEAMPKKKVKEADDNRPKINDYASKNNELLSQIAELKKQLQEKDEIIKKQNEEIENLKTSKVEEIKIEMIVEEVLSDEESSDEESSEDENYNGPYSSDEEDFCDEPQTESEEEDSSEEEEESSSEESSDEESSDEEEIDIAKIIRNKYFNMLIEKYMNYPPSIKKDEEKQKNCIMFLCNTLRSKLQDEYDNEDFDEKVYQSLCKDLIDKLKSSE